MNYQRRLPLVLVATLLIISILAVAYRIPPAAKATYVERNITQNTDWTLVDSPFIVSNDVNVADAATLTIEPGVQVKFGGDFSITVNGIIIADGTSDRTILFTSNSLNATPGDWNTIRINSTQPSSLTHCTIEYASDGTTLEAGTLNLQNNIIRYNTNGTTIYGGTATIQNNHITNNTVNGISIAGGNQATVRNNLITQNENGITLTGNLTGNTDITQNNILQNTENGILLSADTYGTTQVTQNTVSQNDYGIQLFTSSEPNITNNQITNNTAGIYYDIGTTHQTHYNDIYDNTIAIDVSPSATVDATYNYWGDPTGPFHPTMNPNGKGNTAGGSDANLDFIFFLTAPTDYNNAAPTAILTTDKTLVAPGEPVTFIGTYSTDDRQVDQYFFNFGDGANSGWTTLSLFNHTYTTPNQSYTASLTAKDDFNTTSQNTATTTINVQTLTPLTVSMDLSSDTAEPADNITVTVHVSNGINPVQNAQVTMIPLKSGTFTPTTGLTDSNGQLQTTFTAPQVTDATCVRLIATATQTGTYADGSSHANVEVLPPLHVEIINSPSAIKSNSTATLTFLVSGSAGQPLPDATVTATTDQGTLTTTTETTDANGTATFQLTAPVTTSAINATITTTATKSQYTDATIQTVVNIVPKILTVQVTASENPTTSETEVTLTVQVTYNLTPVQYANVTVTTQNQGTLPQTTATTNDQGLATFTYTTPQVNESTNIIITAESTTGYADGQNTLTLTVTPGNITLQVTPDTQTTVPRNTVNLTVTATSNGNPLPDAEITITADAGTFNTTTANTDQNGACTFTYNAPPTNGLTHITANATKNGYFPTIGLTAVNIVPSPQGWPLTTILLIIIPLIIAATVAALIKLRIIIVTSGGESDAE
jgi:parallel beta-helix repeat protein